jgi:hypothetical protein
MARFTVTFHLQGASDADYATLAEAMAAAKFTRLFRDAAGKMYEMPPGSFNFTGKLTAGEVRNRAGRVAAQLNRPFELIVSEAAKRHCMNLREVEPAPAAAGVPVEEHAEESAGEHAEARTRSPIPLAPRRRWSSVPSMNQRVLASPERRSA